MARRNPPLRSLLARPLAALLLSATSLSLAATSASCMSIEDELEGEILLSTQPTDWRDEVIYQLLVDRFANGDPGNDFNVDLTAPGVVTITGLFATVEIRNFDALDRLFINLGNGNDTLDASGVPLALVISGGIGNDTITGGNARDVIVPGAGANTVFFSPGPDLVDAAGGSTLAFIG